jgi:hypothetical protein
MNKINNAKCYKKAVVSQAVNFEEYLEKTKLVKDKFIFMNAVK